jgi:hypothetical protein
LLLGVRAEGWVFCNTLDGTRPANLQTALVTCYASASKYVLICIHTSLHVAPQCMCPMGGLQFGW